jgi:hypothetical protein
VFNLTSIAEAQKEIKNTDEHAEQQRELTKNILTLTKRFVKDSANMKVIATLTALFLPGTFMAIRPLLSSYLALTKLFVRSFLLRQCLNGRTLLTDGL